MFWKLFISALLHFTSPRPIRADHLQATFKVSLNHFDRLGKRIIALFCNQAGRAQDTPTTERSWPDILSKALQIKKKKKAGTLFLIFSQNNAKCLSNHSKEYFSLSMLVPVIVSEQELFRVSLKKNLTDCQFKKKTWLQENDERQSGQGFWTIITWSCLFNSLLMHMSNLSITWQLDPFRHTDVVNWPADALLLQANRKSAATQITTP